MTATRPRTTVTTPAVLAGLVVLVLVTVGLALVTRGDPADAPGGSAPGVASAPASGDGAAADAAGARVAGPGRGPVPLPEGWAGVRDPLARAVDAAAARGFTLTMCVRALDSPGEERVCAGDDAPLFAASLPKVAIAVAALEAVGGDPSAPSGYGPPVGDLVDAAITVSDNEAAGMLVHVAGSRRPDAEPFDVVNAVTTRVGLDAVFHAGNYFTEDEASPGEGEVTASGCVDYLAELVRSADGRTRPDGRSLTSPAVARTVLGAMHRQERTGKLPLLLPPGSTANKTGETEEVSHDMAVVHTRGGRFAVSATGTASDLDGNADTEVAEASAAVAALLGGAVPFPGG